MIEPATYNFNIYQGKSFDRTFTATSGITLSDYSAIRMQIRKTTDSLEVIWDSNLTGGIVITGNSIVLEITDEETANFTFKTAGYDIELIKPTGEVDCPFRGTITNIKEYTKDISA